MTGVQTCALPISWHTFDRKISKQYCPMASSEVNPVIDSAALLRKVILFSRSIVKMPSLMLFRMSQQGVPGLNAFRHDENESVPADSEFLRFRGTDFFIGVNPKCIIVSYQKI